MRLVCCVAAALSLASLGTLTGAWAASGTVYAGSGGTGYADFSLSGAPAACRYIATIRITSMRAILNGNSVSKGSLSATMSESNKNCPQLPLGEKQEHYRLRSGSFDGHTLRLAFASAEDNASKHDVTYTGTLNGDTISGVATFARYDCAPVCNWTVKVQQTLKRQP
jgi:hypothetical protein